uniref:Uncharacterized protein n=1 Tax=Mustela putorius furo TaxID=9669 RepID=M3XTU8_MUSPF
MKIHCLVFILPILFSSPTPGFSGRVLLPFSCLMSRGFCFPLRCLLSGRDWQVFIPYTKVLQETEAELKKTNC